MFLLAVKTLPANPRDELDDVVHVGQREMTQTLKLSDSQPGGQSGSQPASYVSGHANPADLISPAAGLLLNSRLGRLAPLRAQSAV